MSKLIPLTKGKFAIVDDVNYDELDKFNWQAQQREYKKEVYEFAAVRTCYCLFDKKKRIIFMSRQIVSCPHGKTVDHKNHNQLDNHKINLRICTYSQNKANSRVYTKTSTKYKGLHWYKATKKWQVSIRVNKKKIHLGYFENEMQAAKAYDTAATHYFGEFAYLNFNRKRGVS